MRILAIETSCDETAVAVLEASGDFGHDFRFKVLGNALLSQATAHALYGGVFPNLAKREHGRNLVPVLAEALNQAGMLRDGTTSKEVLADIEKILEREKELFGFLKDFLLMHGKPEIDCIAVTAGPGLEPALWVGINFAKALSLAWQLPLVAVNHMEGHVLISLLGNMQSTTTQETNSTYQIPYTKFQFPALALLVSGGHTELVLIKEFTKYEIVGETRDDAAGEAFDKCARILGLPYPGGPEIAKLAALARASGRTSDLKFPRPMQGQDNLDFSFSGLKTAVHRHVGHVAQLAPWIKEDIARAVEDAIVDVLVSKTIRAAEAFGIQTLIVGGGVSANAHLRGKLAEHFHDSLLFPSPEMATDNAVMIALAGYFRAQKKEFIEPEALRAQGNLRLA